MSVKIFLPAEIFYRKEDCDIYGEIQISENNSVSYFVVGYTNSGLNDFDSSTRLRHLGFIVRAGPVHESRRRDVSLTFAYDADTPNIYLIRITIHPPHISHVNIFLYEAAKILELHVSGTKDSARGAHAVDGSGDHGGGQCEDIRMLFQLQRTCQCSGSGSVGRDAKSMVKIIAEAANTPLELEANLFLALMEWRPLTLPLQHTMLYKHYLEWRKFRTSGRRMVNITLDRLMGILIMLLLLLYVSQPGDYLLQASYLIIKQLRLLLQALKGNPIGLKLNSHLNNFFLDCFNYHVDLWAKFIGLIEPIVRQLFVPIALLGSMGLSYQLAVLCDLISVMGLHAHCFYIYTAVLYKVQIKGIKVLWKVMLGKRLNILKSRVESHNYMNRQLYLATIFFTTLLFLFPTILVYYVVFTTLRLCIFIINSMVQAIRRQILEFPIQSVLQWLTGHFYEIESIQLQHIQHEPSPLLQSESKHMGMSVFKINVKSSSLTRVFSCESRILQKLTTHEQISLKSIFQHILEGTF